MFGLWETPDDLPPAPPNSAVFVMRNGRYEPQNLMPILPRPDILDFDGFVMRRGASTGYRHTRPPEMRQATLIKNPVSIRRDSARVTARAPDMEKVQGDALDALSKPEAPSPTIADTKTNDAWDTPVILSFTFDAVEAGSISVHLLVSEVERHSTSESGVAEKRLELLPQEPYAEVSSTDADQHKPATASMTFDRKKFKPGLCQVYETPPLKLGQWPEQSLTFDADHPNQIPMAIQIDVDADDGGGEACIHYSYVSFQRIVQCQKPEPWQGQWAVHIFSQKLQYGNQCFVLHEVFGANSKTVDVDTGNSDCVICLSAPRDTAVLPCRHMCFCSYCAGIVRLQCDTCPVCRQKVASLLQFRREGGSPADSPSAITQVQAHTHAINIPVQTSASASDAPAVAGGQLQSC
mmetsp:Transcript_45606/g.90453  ORF Transcript_45606/g.90453 Transcript_45606/m.90453 type:complete len:407 (-) Transcript_45606:29-1249(-)